MSAEQDLVFGTDITSVMNNTYYHLCLNQDDNHLPVLDMHPADLLKLYSKTHANQDTQMQINSVHDPTSGAYLEYRELIKTEQ